MGDHIKKAKKHHEQHLEKYPFVDEVYLARYVELVPASKEATQFLGSPEATVGTLLLLKSKDGETGFYTEDDRHIASLQPDVHSEIKELVNNEWITRCFLAYSTFNAKDKTIFGHAICFCYDPALPKDTKDAIECFIKNTMARIAHRTYLDTRIEQAQFVKIIESKGEWFLIKEAKWPKLPKGTIYYRRRRTLKDRLIDAAYQGNKGCVVASYAVMFIIIAGIGLLVWFFFFR